MPFPTQAEKLSRVNSTLTSKLTSKGGRTFSSTECPLLYGVAVRAIHRKAQGLELSKLEKNVAGLWAAFVHDDNEIAEYSKLFTQQDVAQRLPKAITQLPIDKQYTWEDLRRDIVENPGPAAAESPNFEIVDLATANSIDETTSSDASKGVTFYTSSAPLMNTTGFDGFRKIYLDRFVCVRKQDDGVFGGKNEIYWSYSSADNVAPSKHTVTREYGSIKSGDKADFSSDTILYSGTIGPKSIIAAHIECWEADDSNSSWVDDLKGAMLEVSDMLLDAAATSATSPDGKESAAVLAILAGISALIAGIIAWFRNDDDLVKERSIMLDYAALLHMWKEPAWAEWHFNGGGEGYHKLYLAYN